MKKGKVYLIGAGPGDIGLLTIKGMKCLQKAEVVVYDFHLNAQILNYINHDAEFIYAGKRGGHHAMTQDEINQALVDKAKEGKIVCRLKGGDPFVFGRGGEEAEVLVKEGIEFEVIPGVSSSIAAPAYAGIPLTHRKYSSSFAVITGNEDITKPESSIDWTKFANGFDTLVFLMGVKNIGAITSKLIEHGKSPDTPTAVVRWGTRPDQKTVVSTLKDIAGLVKEENIKPPAVMVVGNVVKLRDTLKWYENKPLFGQRILITREYTKDYEPLEDLGAEIFGFQTIEIAPPESYKELDESIDKVETYNWIIFTSANGFKYFMQRLLDKNKDLRDLRGIKICAIGTKTAEAIRNYGIKVDLIPEEFNAEGLIETFIKGQGSRVKGQELKGIKILLPRAEVAREVFPQKVRELGGEIDTPAAYRAIKPEKHGKRLKRFLKEGRISVATFTSAATFNNFVDIMGDDAIEILKDVTIAVIGPVTAKAIEKAGLKVSIMPKEATIKAMVDEIIQWAAR
ncbi:MAG: uroporphyrinogen-III C-methyltransferase [Nitrospirae bacterium]|nr:uroporphyrinogen-III C-methyltransferase [Nitrospirota bacterium]MDA8338403.1 uroporphyrinogen-III C-methyltransferase [Nitrospiraceae bacterium]